MIDLRRKYRTRYVYSFRFGQPHHSYELIGPKGGIHLHITDLGSVNISRGGPRYSAGIEIHYRNAPDDRAPDHDECWLLRCPCWHEGSSLYADEHWVPLFETYQMQPQEILDRLHIEAEHRFEEAAP